MIELRDKPKKEKKKHSKENFEQLTYSWLLSKKNIIKESSYGRYYNLIETHIVPNIGHIKKNKITSELINNFLTKELQEGRLDKNGGLSTNTVYDIALIIKQTCKKYNININVIPISKSIGKGKNFYPQETKILQKNLTKLNSLDSIGILISLLLGLREGEVCGLKWKDIDTENKIIHVNRIITRVRCFDGKRKTKIIITTPKTESSIRELPIPDKLIPILDNVKRYSNQEYFILTNKAKYLDPRTYYNHYKLFLKSLDVTNHTYHDLRHTFATNCIELGMDAKTLMELLGHSNITTTLSIYVHSSMNCKRNFINQL